MAAKWFNFLDTNSRGHSCSFRSNLLSFRIFRCPLFPKSVSWIGLFAVINQFKKQCSSSFWITFNVFDVSGELRIFFPRQDSVIVFFWKTRKNKEIIVFFSNLLTSDAIKIEPKVLVKHYCVWFDFYCIRPYAWDKILRVLNHLL